MNITQLFELLKTGGAAFFAAPLFCSLLEPFILPSVHNVNYFFYFRVYY